MALMVFLALVACAAEPVVPHSGWYAVQPEPTVWSCEAEGPDDAAPAEGLAWVELGESWRWADDVEPVPCIFEGVSFSCEVYDTGVAYGESTHTDASVTTSAQLNARWNGTDALSGETVAGYACSGEDCSEIAEDYAEGFAFPCLATTVWSAERVVGDR